MAMKRANNKATKKSDERRSRLVKEHWDRELQAWKFFRFELERRWDLLYPGFNERDYIHRVEYVTASAPEIMGGAQKFLKQYFNAERRGEFEENALAQADGLIFRARRRLRSRYHFSLTEAPPVGYSVVADRPQMQSFHLYLTLESLAAGMKLASALDYVVTLSTPSAGASQRTFHFLAMPRLLCFGECSYALYQWLEERPIIPLLGPGNVVIDLVVYPAFCVRVKGISRHVAPVVWRLAEQYGDLVSFSLVITPGQDIEHSSVFFFPRPFKPDWEGPQKYIDKDWSFGAFEMGGFFVQGDKHVYDELTYETLCRFLKKVSIFDLRPELQQITDLLGRLTLGSDTETKIQRYCEEASQLTRKIQERKASKVRKENKTRRSRYR